MNRQRTEYRSYQHAYIYIYIHSKTTAGRDSRIPDDIIAVECSGLVVLEIVEAEIWGMGLGS